MQIVQFTSQQLDPLFNIPSTTKITTSKFCSLSAGPLKDLSVVAAGNVSALSQSPMTIKLYNSVDCNPSTAGQVFTVPNTVNACNRYNATISPRFFKIRCLSGETYASLYASTKFYFRDFGSQSECESSDFGPILSSSGVGPVGVNSDGLLRSGRQADVV
jgi:hypothetical protein